MGYIDIHPDSRDLLHANGLTTAKDALCREGVIVTGHPDRHVVEVDLREPGASATGAHPVAVRALLKKEHRVRWWHRFESLMWGFGLVSRSRREAINLQRVRDSGIPCPEWLAHGQAAGKAFLLVREATGMRDLRVTLQEASPAERQTLARELGRAVARVHAVGFDHPDLYAKHVLVGPGQRFCFLDWQRSRKRAVVPWAIRCRDLALLDASLSETLASARNRLGFWRAYVQEAVACGAPLNGDARRDIVQRSARLRGQTRFREMHPAPLPSGSQSVVWLDGEALCVTRAFREELKGHVPRWLHSKECGRSTAERLEVPLPNGRWATLARRVSTGLGRFWKKAKTPPEMEQAVMLFRLERHAVPAPRLLAFGKRRTGTDVSSFVLAEPPRVSCSLASFLRTERSRRRRLGLIERTGALLRRLHEAGYALAEECRLADECGIAFHEDIATPVLCEVTNLVRRKSIWRDLAVLDLRRLRETNRALHGRSEILRFFLGYLGRKRTTAEDRRLLDAVLGRREGKVAA